MRKHTATLVARRCDETAHIGLVVRGTPTIDGMIMVANSGLSIAHDLLEHLHGVERIGEVGDELEALGATLWLRGHDLRPGEPQYYSVEHSLASDVALMAYDNILARRAPAPERTRSQRVPEWDTSVEEILLRAAESFRDEVRDFPAEDRPRPGFWAAYAAEARRRIHRGIRLARKRYPSQAQAYNLFVSIMQAVEPYARHCEYEGQEFRLRYGYRGGEDYAICEEHYEEDEE
jgi:hypothetical protein